MFFAVMFWVLMVIAFSLGSYGSRTNAPGWAVGGGGLAFFLAVAILGWKIFEKAMNQ